MLCSISAIPKAFSNTDSPFSETPTAQPGAGMGFVFDAFSNARSAPAMTFALSGTCAKAEEKKMKERRRLTIFRIRSITSDGFIEEAFG
jgi:hypothetical protein